MVFGKYKKLIKKLFGDMEEDLLHTYSEDWETRDVGFLGQLDGRLTKLNDRLTKLEKKFERRFKNV